MDTRSTPDFMLEAFADPASVRDVVSGILHAIFFNRFFPSVVPQTREVLDLTLPHVADVELETMIDQRVAALVRQLDADRNQPHHHQLHQGSGSSQGGSGRGQVAVQFYERRRRKATGWYNLNIGRGNGEEEVCWESWTVKVTVAEPRTESERAKVRKAMESTLLATVMKIITYVNTHKDHIPPITTTDSNPFPYQIRINQKDAGWTTRMGWP